MSNRASEPESTSLASSGERPSGGVGVSSAAMSSPIHTMLHLQRSAGNAAVTRLIQRQPNLDAVRSALPESSSPSPAAADLAFKRLEPIWILEMLDICAALDRSGQLDPLLAMRGQAAPRSRVAMLAAKMSGRSAKAPDQEVQEVANLAMTLPRQQQEETVRWLRARAGPAAVHLAGVIESTYLGTAGTYIDDFDEAIYDIDYRISEKGGPSEYLKLKYRDGTVVELNWYEFEHDKKLAGTEVTDALAQRRVGKGNRIFPKRLAQQTAPRLAAAFKDMEEIGATSTLQLMKLSLTAVMYVITIGPPAPRPGGGSAPKANRRAVPRMSPGLAKLSPLQRSVAAETQGILRSKELRQLRQAHAAGKEAYVTINGRNIQYEPGMPASGMTNFEDNGFALGREAFSSEQELTKTLMHELHRLTTSASKSQGVGHELAAAETAAAQKFADELFDLGVQIGLWGK